MQRRALLKTTAVSLGALSAGCLSPVLDSENPAVQLAFVGVQNADPDAAHVFEIEVERDGEHVHRSTHEVAAATPLDNGFRLDGAVAECEWGSTPGDYTVRVSIDGVEERERSVTAFASETGAECVLAEAEFRNHDATSEYQTGSSLAIFLRDCDRWEDEYEDEYLCPFTQE